MLSLFKNRKPVVYIFLGIYIFLIGVLIFESCLKESNNAINDEFFANIYAFMSNTGGNANEGIAITWDEFVKKFAGHISFYLLMSVVGFLFFYFLLEEKDHNVIFSMCLSLFVGLLVAGISEWIQYFVPSRNASFRDILTDFLGVLIGVMLCLMVWGIIHLIKRTRDIKKENEAE